MTEPVRGTTEDVSAANAALDQRAMYRRTGADWAAGGNVSSKPARPGNLTDAELVELGNELDAIRQGVLDSRGERDASYIRRLIKVQRVLELGSRVVLLGSRHRGARLVGATGLALAKILDNMEIGHNVLHGQWDWMRDPEDPLDHLGVGPRLSAGAVEARTQRGAPHLHQHRGS